MQLLIVSIILATALATVPRAPAYKHSLGPPTSNPTKGLGNVPRPIKKRLVRAAPAPYRPAPTPAPSYPTWGDAPRPAKKRFVRAAPLNKPAHVYHAKRSAETSDPPTPNDKEVKLPPQPW